MQNEEIKTDGTALVLEGGGMRGIYTTGVLDFFLDNNLYFDYVIGVSAGASHALSYITRQKGRAKRVNVDYCRRPDYLGLGCLRREKSLFGMDLLFRKIPYELDPYDFEAFEKFAGIYYAVATNMKTGQPGYLTPRTAQDVLPAAQASCSLPFVSVPVVIDGDPYLDGGISDSIPVRHALADGNRKAVLVLTQPAGYRKKEKGKSLIVRKMYREYPEFIHTMENRNRAYNEVLDHIDRLEAEGTVFVVRPKPQPGLKRLERDPEKLNGLYRSGYEDMAALFPALKEFLEK
ncbi:patatin family protein [Brucepastera parasyntrophica]|uniref:patatin-like phospholipase family protein n=1 Tax=Brucepastera parasyntrophica TaxID=2880008 RepID=UPI00210B660A|nr:patatin family protein [Brucepastera parasyntrophica]ULQ58742.1 patatin family protein [Brucepastera parasyntrophica]